MKLLRNITKGISWFENCFLFEPKDNLTHAEYNLVDYINDSTPVTIDRDIRNISILKTNDKFIIERFIMDDLMGFTSYDNVNYAHIAGATDQSPNVLYDLNTNVLFITHPNFPVETRFDITPEDLIDLLIIKRELYRILQVKEAPNED